MKTLLQPESVYHIYNHANGSDNLFREQENYKYFLKKYFEYINPIAQTYAYCLMPNHFHMMIRIKGKEELVEYFNSKKPGFKTLEEVELSYLISRQFSNLFNGYTQAFNKRYNRRGSLFMSNFKRKEVDDNSYFSGLIRYIHNNPIHHKFVKDIFSWEHSSIHTLSSLKSGMVAQKEVLRWFGGKDEFLKYHTNSQPSDFHKRFEFE